MISRPVAVAVAAAASATSASVTATSTARRSTVAITHTASLTQTRCFCTCRLLPLSVRCTSLNNSHRSHAPASTSIRSFHSTPIRFASSSIKVPSMGDSITDGTLLEFCKQVGDAVAVDDIVARIETDKVTVDVRTPHAGVITKFKAKPEDTVNVGSELMEIDSDAKASPSAPKSQPSQPAESQPAPPSHSQPTQSKPSPASVPQASSHSDSDSASSSHSRAHQPRIHFRYGLRDSDGTITGQPKSQHAPATTSKSTPASAPAPAPANNNTPPSPASFFTTSNDERKAWADANRAAAAALANLPAFYKSPPLRLSPAQCDMIQFGGAETYLSPAEKKAAAVAAKAAKAAKAAQGKKAKA